MWANVRSAVVVCSNLYKATHVDVSIMRALAVRDQYEIDMVQTQWRLPRNKHRNHLSAIVNIDVNSYVDI